MPKYLVDSSGNGHDVTVFGSPTLEASPHGAGFGNHAKFPDGSGANIDGAPFDLNSFATWTVEGYAPPMTLADQFFCGVWDNTNNDSHQFVIGVTPTTNSGRNAGGISFTYGLSGSGVAAISAPVNSALDGNPHHWRVTSDGVTLTLEVDGVVQQSTPLPTFEAYNPGTPFAVGYVGGYGGEAVEGVDEIRISDIVRTGSGPFTPDANTVGLWHLDAFLTTKTTAQNFYPSTNDQDFTAAGEVDIRAMAEGATTTLNTTKASHPNSAGTTSITLDPYTTRTTQGDIAADAGWAINKGDMVSEALAKRYTQAGVWSMRFFVQISNSNSTGSHTTSFHFKVYRVSASGARTLLFTSNESDTLSTGLLGAAGSGVLTASSASQPTYILEADETLHVGVISKNVQSAGLLGGTAAGVATFRTGLVEYLTVPAPGIRTYLPRDNADSAAVGDSVGRVVFMPRDLADSANVTDAVARSIIYGRELTDSVPVVDAMARQVHMPRSLDDAAPVSEVLGRQAIYGRGLADAATVADALTRLAMYLRQMADAAPVTDDADRQAMYGRGLFDAITPVSEVLTRKVTANRKLNDSAPVTDGIGRQVIYGRPLADGAPVSDFLGRRLEYKRSLLDAMSEGGGTTIINIKPLIMLVDD